MCGIAGILSARPFDPAILRAMGGAIANRGPDDHGEWHDEAAGVGLSHRRLSIVDLSPRGHQPMASASGRFVLCYNGEIYNHAELRARLEAGDRIAWRSDTDTETLVEAIAAWGVSAALEQAVGMFAFALWDNERRELTLARDRFGEKPLYYGWNNGAFLFGSDLRALRAVPGFDPEVDRRALKLLAARAYIPAPLSIYRDIYKLEPGCLLKITLDAAASPPTSPPAAPFAAHGFSVERYWSYRAVVTAGLANPVTSEGDAIDGLEHALQQAIAGQSVADVPVGAFLSGGIDSSTVVGVYQSLSPKTIRTYSIGFEDKRYNEAGYAKAVAAHFGTEHHELYLTPADCLAQIPNLPTYYSEPFADSSQIPTYFVSRFARQDVTVALSGDGGDELFGGYNRYFGTARLWSAAKKLPTPLRTLVVGRLAHLPPQFWQGLGRIAGDRVPPQFGYKVRKALRTVGGARDLDGVFETFLDEWSGERNPVRMEEDDVPATRFDLAVPGGDAARMMYCDATSYLPDDILCKVDRAAMAVSLETRVPFLDHRVAAFAARIPTHMKIRGGKGKHVLKQLLFRHAPPALFDRPKAGFGMPLGDWMRGPLRDWCESLLDPRRLAEGGYWHADQLRARWQDHLAGRRDAGPTLWPILMFEAWRDSVATGGAR